MVLQALARYYEILKEDPYSDVPLKGYSQTNVSFAVNISLAGELLNIIPLKIQDKSGKKFVPRPMIVPEQVKRANGINSNFLCDNGIYFFGLNAKGDKERAIKCFEAFKEVHIKYLSSVDSDEAHAVLNYIDKWDPNLAEEHETLKLYKEELLKGANLVFQYEANEKAFVHENLRIRETWESLHQESNSEQTKMRQCLISGNRGSIARLHPSVQGIKGGQSMGVSLVSFNASAYESYGNEGAQGLNAPVSEYATFAYGTALKQLLTLKKHKLYIGDTTVVFWAETAKQVQQDCLSLFLEPTQLIHAVDNVNGHKDEGKLSLDPSALSEVRHIFEKIGQGKMVFDIGDVIDPATRVYILGLTPNAARASIRFFVEDKMGSFISKLLKHYQDMFIEKQYETDYEIIPVWRLLMETVSDKSSDKASSPLLSGSVMRSILQGSRYPESLYQAVMRRIKSDRNINYYRAAILKACLIRKNINHEEEIIQMSLNEATNKKAYILGRLFAVLEKAQEDANPGLTATIKDKYFTSACSTPGVVFPILFKLSSHHIAKSDYGHVSDKRIKEIMERLDVEQDPFPKHLSLDEQGVFVLGYYQQKNAFYKKVEKEN